MTASEVDRPVDGLSPTSLDTWETCPKRFWFEKVEKAPQGPPTLNMLAGTAVHRVIELLMFVPPAQRTIDTATGFARRATAEALDGDLDEASLTAFKYLVWEGVVGYFGVEDPAGVVCAASERYVEAVVGGVPLRGYIDRLAWDGDDLLVDDFKNGKPPTFKYRGRKLRQLWIYGLILEELGTPAAGGRMIFTTAGEVITTGMHQDLLGATLEDAQDAWAGIAKAAATGDWAPSRGPLCAWCPYLADCEAGQAEVLERHRAGRIRADAPGTAWVVDNHPR